MPGKNALKKWLSDRTHSLLGVKRLQALLAQLQEQLQAGTAADESQLAAAEDLRIAVESLRAAISEAGPILHARRDVQPDVPALQALDKQGLFILGCARSGTTILARSLNRSPDVLLLEEANLFLLNGVCDFVSYFNKHHASMGNRCLKGTYLTPPLASEDGPMATLLRLGSQYRLIGEKVALGPHDYPPNWSQAYLDIQGKFFFHAKYLHIMRTPVESIWSQHKMFPDRPISRLFEIWLKSIALSLDAYHIFPNSKILFFDDLGHQLIERLSIWLEVPIPTLPGTFGRKYMYSALPPDGIPEPLLPFEELCRECTALYRDLRENFSREEFVYCGSTTEWAYFDTVQRQIQQTIDSLSTAEPARRAQLRIAA